MSSYEIKGGRPLEGRLAVHGAKNSVLPILAATLLAPGQSIIRNCPALSDVSVTLEILRVLGCQAEQCGDCVIVDASAIHRTNIPGRLMGEMRSSVIFLGALLARMGGAQLSYPGGCELGPRPIDIHISALRALGAVIHEDEGCLRAQRGCGMQGREICLPSPSVGATENLMLAACGCPGVTTLVGGAREPEIVDLQNFLCAMGARVSGAGGRVITIQGGVPLHPADFAVMGDRIVAATYLCAVGATRGRVELTGVAPDTMRALLPCLTEAGCRIRTGPGLIALESNDALRGIAPVRTAPHPGFPTDAQAILMAALAGGRGNTLFVENMFQSRYHHVAQLRRMGAQIQVDGRVAIVTGAGKLHAASVECPDLRGGAALVVAGLAAQGTTRITQLQHIYRGYQGLDQALRSLGAQICEVPSV